MRLLRRDELLLAGVLSALSGFVDSIGFIGLGGYFVSFMSGNTTRFAVGAMQWNVIAVEQTAALLAAFFVGVLIGAAIVRFVSARPAVLAFVTVALGCGALVTQLDSHRVGLTIVAVAMGALNSMFQRDGEVAIGLTYMTGTLVKAGQRLVDAFAGGPRWLWLRHLALWMALCGGAVGGAFSYRATGTGALWMATAFAAALTVAEPSTRRRPWARRR